MPTTVSSPCRSPYRLWVNGVATHRCKCGHYGQVDVTLAPRQQASA